MGLFFAQMASELFEMMYKQMLDIASDEDFPEEEYTVKVLEGCDPTLKGVRWDKLSEEEHAKKREECKDNVQKLRADLEKKFKTGKQSDAKVWNDNLINQLNDAFVQEFVDNGVPIMGYGFKNDAYIDKLFTYSDQVLEILRKADFKVPKEELKDRRERIARRARYALSPAGGRLILPLATSGSFWAIYRCFEKCPGALREVRGIFISFRFYFSFFIRAHPCSSVHYTSDLACS